MTTIVRRGWMAALVGFVACAIGVAIEPRQALTSYLFAYATALTIVLGALMHEMIANVTGARWFDSLRPVAERVTDALPMMGLLALPVLGGVHWLYPWSHIEWIPVDLREIVARKQAWLNVPFFVGRGVLYLVGWLVVRAFVRRAGRSRGASAVGLIACGLTLTFAAFDWLMSLEPAWYSTVYGVYLFAGAALASLGTLIALGHRARVWGDVPDPDRVGATGKMLLAYAMFWVYIAFAQYLIIWMGDVPSDVSWYLARAHGSWGALAIVVGLGQFVAPLGLLLSRAVSRNPQRLARIGMGLVAMHVLDVYWLVLPALHPTGIRPSWLDGAALLLVGGALTATIGATPRAA